MESPRVGLCERVDPFIGCEASDLPKPEGIAATWWCAKPAIGNTHPGACLPFGMVSACAYSGAYVTGYGRYAVSLDGGKPEPVFEDLSAYGIAHFQQSGTGRIRMYYNYLLTMPVSGPGLEGLGKCFRLTAERASPGFYAGRLEEIGVDFEVTTSPRSAHHRYRFPPGETARIAIDLAAGGLRIEGMETRPSEASVALTTENVCRGWTRMEGISIHFEIDVRTPIAKSGLWADGRPIDGNSRHFSRVDLKSKDQRFGVWFEAPESESEIEVRIGFSLQSVERAQLALLPVADSTFAQIANEASQSWNDALSSIEVEGGSEDQRQVFYTSFYHAALKPMDFKDENPFTRMPGPFFFDISTLWDHYKTHLPLVMSLWPDWGGRFVEFLVEVREREGAFPICYTMDNQPEKFAKQATGLSHLVLADAYHRGISADWTRVLKLLERSCQGGKFKEYAERGIVEPLSHTLDLASAFFSMAQLARSLGDESGYDDAIRHAGHWRNAFDESTGLLKTDSTYYEGENWNYSFRFLHDMAGRIELAGGERNFVRLLDLFFGFSEPNHGEVVHRFEGLNNEPDMEAPFAYLYAGRHDRTARVVRRVMRNQFSTGRGGLPGNEDSGALSSWFVWNAIGVFPVAGQPVMLIGSPLFERSVMHLPGGDFVVEAENQGEDHVFVESAKLNGKPLDRAWLKLSEFQQGGVLSLTLSDQPTDWASESRPPSSAF